jgi:hypothetical protein
MDAIAAHRRERNPQRALVVPLSARPAEGLFLRRAGTCHDGTVGVHHIVAKASAGSRFNEHMEGDGPTVFAHTCKMGFEGIVSKKDSAYRSGRSPDWLKMENADAPAVKREEEEDWKRGR